MVPGGFRRGTLLRQLGGSSLLPESALLGGGLLLRGALLDLLVPGDFAGGTLLRQAGRHFLLPSGALIGLLLSGSRRGRGALLR